MTWPDGYGDLDTAVPGLAQRPPHNHVGYSSVVISHKEFSSLCRPTTLKQLVSYVSYARIAKKVGGIWIVDARQRHLDDPSLSVKVRQEVPPPSGASLMRKIDGGFSCDVVLAGHAFEIKIKKWLPHGSLLRRAKPCFMWPAFSPIAVRAVSSVAA